MNIDIEELKKSESSKIPIDELSEFIQEKTNQEYLVVSAELLRDFDQQLFENTKQVFSVNELWCKLIDANRATSKKWEKELSISKAKK